MVPIRDLIDLSFARGFVSHAHSVIRGRIMLSKPVNDDTSKTFWEYALEGIFFSLICLNTDLPAPYYPNLAALEKKDTLTETLISLEKSFFNANEKKE